MELEPGAVARNYLVDGVVGVGGVATVYRVRHRDLGTVHALKLLRVHGAGVARRLLLEGRSQAAIRHPNIVAVTDTVDLRGETGLVMEYIDGPTLQELLNAGPVAVAEADALARGILAGLVAAHAQGFIHRDLKPGNVLLEIAGGQVVPKIADFGLARVLDSVPDLHATRAGMTIGTPPYMAPEQIADARRADGRADVFSAGALLYELLSGNRAFEGDDVATVYDAIRAGRYVALPVELPERMRRAVASALNPDREHRTRDAATLLAQWVDGTPDPHPWLRERLDAIRSIAPPIRSGDASASPPARASLALAPPLLAASASPSESPTPAMAPVRPWRGWLGGAAAVLLLVLGARAAWTPDAAPKSNGSTPLTVTPLTARPSGSFVEAVAVSDDGATLAWIEEQTVMVRNERTRAYRQHPLDLPRQVIGLDLLPDGQLVFGQWSVGAVVHAMQCLDPSSGVVTPLPWRGIWPRVSPDGTHLAWVDGEAIWVAELPDGGPRRLHSLPFVDNGSSLAWSPDGKWILAGIDDFPQTRTELRLLASDGSRSVVLREKAGISGGGPDPVGWLAMDRVVLLERGRGKVKLLAFDLDVNEGTVSDPQTLHTWPGFGLRGMDIDRAGTTLTAVIETVDEQVKLLRRTDAGYSEPEELVRDRREELALGWLDPRRLLLLVRRETWDVVAVDAITGRSEPYVRDDGDEGFGCLLGGELLIHSSLPGGVLGLSWVRNGTPVLAATTTPWPAGVLCAPDRTDRVWLRQPDGGVETLEPFDLATGARGAPIWRSDPGTMPHAMSVSADGARAWTAVDDVLTEIDLATGRVTRRAQPLVYPTLGLGPDGEPWIVGLVEDGSEIRRIDDNTLVASGAGRWLTPMPSPDGAYIAIHTSEGSADVWQISGLGGQ